MPSSHYFTIQDFLRCPPGPLGFNCDSDDSGGGGGGGGSSSSSNGYWSSSSSKNEASDSGSSANESDGTSNKWYGGSGNSAEKSGISGAVWMMIIGGIAIVSTAAAYIAHRTVSFTTSYFDKGEGSFQMSSYCIALHQ